MTLRLIAIAALVVAATTFTTPASATPPGPADVGCGFATTNDVNPEAPPDSQIGEIDGGPITQSGILTCTIQIGANMLHADYDNGSKATATGTGGVTVLTPQFVSYQAPANTNVWLCDQFTDAQGVTYVYDDADEAWERAAGNTSASCRLAITVGTDDPVLDTANEVADLTYDVIELGCSLTSDSQQQCPPYMCDLGVICIGEGRVYVLPRS